MKLSNAKLGTRLAMIGLAGLGACALVALTAFFGLRSLGNAETLLAEDALPSLRLIADINDDADNLRLAQFELTQLAGTPQLAQVEGVIGERSKSLAQHLAQYERRIDNAEERALYDAMRSAVMAFIALTDEARTLVGSGDPAQLEQARSLATAAAAAAFVAVGNAIDALHRYNDQAVDASHAEAEHAASLARTLLFVIFVLGVIVTGGIAYGLARQLMRQTRAQRRGRGRARG